MPSSRARRSRRRRWTGCASPTRPRSTRSSSVLAGSANTDARRGAGRRRRARGRTDRRRRGLRPRARARAHRATTAHVVDLVSSAIPADADRVADRAADRARLRAGDREPRHRGAADGGRCPERERRRHGVPALPRRWRRDLVIAGATPACSTTTGATIAALDVDGHRRADCERHGDGGHGGETDGVPRRRWPTASRACGIVDGRALGGARARRGDAPGTHAGDDRRMRDAAGEQ